MIARPPRPLSFFDRAGIVIVSMLGTCIGLLAALMSDTTFTPIFAVVVPGIVAGVLAAKIFGTTAAVFSTALANGAICRSLLYAWDRLTNALVDRIPSWVGNSIRILKSRWL